MDTRIVLFVFTCSLKLCFSGDDIISGQMVKSKRLNNR